MDTRSEHSLLHVHPDLVKVVRRAAETTQFIVICGSRSLAEQQVLVHTGKSTTMHSRHLVNREGLACAVDICATLEGVIRWDDYLYKMLADKVKAAAAAVGVHVEWGGDWKSFHDLDHFQLPWSEYP